MALIAKLLESREGDDVEFRELSREEAEREFEETPRGLQQGQWKQMLAGIGERQNALVIDAPTVAKAISVVSSLNSAAKNLPQYRFKINRRGKKVMVAYEGEGEVTGEE